MLDTFAGLRRDQKSHAFAVLTTRFRIVEAIHSTATGDFHDITRVLRTLRVTLFGRPSGGARELYAATFIVAAPQGSQAFTNDARFLEWLRQVAASNREHGMRSLTAVALAETMLSPRHALVIVTWGAQFEKTGKRVIEFQISYLLEKDADAWRILAYVSQADQEEEMRKAGLL